MNVRLVREIAQAIAVLVVCIFIVILVVGCANIPFTMEECNAAVSPTAHEHELCLKAATDYEQEQHEREDRHLIYLDELVIMLNACNDSSSLVIVEDVHIRSCLPSDRAKRKALKEYGYEYTHDNVKCRRYNTVGCVGQDDVRRLIRLGHF